MAKVMIRCPVTGRLAFTGIETDPGSANFIPPINARVKCPQCGGTHLWSILEAELLAREGEELEEIPADLRSRLGRIRGP